MAFRSRKEKQQVIILIVVLTIIVGVLAVVYRESWLPHAVTSGAGMPPPKRIALPSAVPTDVFDRPDFIALKKYGDVPVKPLNQGSTDIFKELK